MYRLVISNVVTHAYYPARHIVVFMISYFISSNKEGDMGLPAISGLIGGILAIIAGIVVLIKPQIIAWVVGIFLIIFGISAVVAVL